jgi:hypothetical protein
MLPFRVEGHQLIIGEHLAITFQRTLRIPDDGRTYPLPPGLGTFPVMRVEDFEDRVPAAWNERPGVFIPMYQREAMWLGFSRPQWKPCALKVGVGRVNAVTGEGWDDALHGEPQDYVVCPAQPWLDGIKQGGGTIRQFVAMPLGMGYTVEAQVTGREEFGGIQLLAFEPRPGRFPDRPPPVEPAAFTGMAMSMPFGAAGAPAPGAAMGLAAGGRMEQKVYPDPHGVDTWDPESRVEVVVHVVDSLTYREITGEEPPPTPVTARTYAEYGFPWFRLYDEGRRDLEWSEKLRAVKSVREMDAEKGFGEMQDDGSVDVAPDAVIPLTPPPLDHPPERADG